MANILEISLPSESIIEIGNFPVTNSILATLLVSLILIGVGIFIKRRISLVPSRGQIIIEEIITFFLNQLRLAYGSEKTARKHLPYILTIFLLILIANQFSIIPLLTSVITKEGTPIFRTPTSDYSLPIAMALMSFLICNLMAITVSPLKFIGKFIKIVPILKARSLGQFGMAFIELFLGLLDIIGELAKVVSTSSRLFGNIIAGEIMVLVISSLSIYTQFIVPLPFMFLSMFSGLIQAFVFTILWLNFMASTIPAPKENLHALTLRQTQGRLSSP